jgi:hypothetical protein
MACENDDPFPGVPHSREASRIIRRKLQKAIPAVIRHYLQ